MTVTEFLAWEAPGGSDRWELVDGQPVARTPASRRHNTVVARMADLLGSYLDGHPRYRVVIEPSVQLDDHNILVPDIVVTSDPISWGNPLLREPRLIVVITSTSIAPLAAYMALPSVIEVLVLDSQTGGVELPRRPPNASWLWRTIGPRDMLALASLGFTVPMAEVYRTAAIRRAGRRAVTLSRIWETH
jgi:Uma2 family endonuclease